MGLVAKDDGWRIPDELWERMKRLLPPGKPHPLGCHNPAVPARAAMNAILFVLRTGCQWNALDATGICSSSSAHRWFQTWREAGVFLRFWERGLLKYDRLKGIDWTWLSMDGALTKAPLGGEKNRSESYGSRQGRSEAKPAYGGAGHSSGNRHRWSQSQRLQDGARDDPSPSHSSPAAYGSGTARDVPGQGI